LPNIYLQFRDTARLDKCGSNAPLVVLYYIFWTSYNSSIYACAVLSVVSSILSATFCIISLISTRGSFASKDHAWLRKVAGCLKRFRSKRWHPLFRAFISLQQLLYFFFLVASLYNFIHFKSGGAVLTNSRAIGQITSVMIWAPVIYKYIYGSICKFRACFPFSIISAGLTQSTDTTSRSRFGRVFSRPLSNTIQVYYNPVYYQFLPGKCWWDSTRCRNTPWSARWYTTGYSEWRFKWLNYRTMAS
jgi:hypothetical protein